jgi:hypothetical protein
MNQTASEFPKKFANFSANRGSVEAAFCTAMQQKKPPRNVAAAIGLQD